MPTYEYRCRACRHRFEQFQRMSDAPVRLCPSCGEHEVERLISTGGGIVFKGPGFYATDYRQSRGGGKKEDGAEEKGGSSAGPDKDAAS